MSDVGKRLVKRLRSIAKSLREEADNISPFNDDGSGGESHPAPTLRRKAKALDNLAKDFEELDT